MNKRNVRFDRSMTITIFSFIVSVQFFPFFQFRCVLLYRQRRRIHRATHRYQYQVRTNSNRQSFNPIGFVDHHPIQEEKSVTRDPDGHFRQPPCLRSFEDELTKVDQYFQNQAPDVRRAILDSLQRMYHQNEWHDNPLTIICRDLDIHVPANDLHQ